MYSIAGAICFLVAVAASISAGYLSGWRHGEGWGFLAVIILFGWNWKKDYEKSDKECEK
jgi:hypothetical protein